MINKEEQPNQYIKQFTDEINVYETFADVLNKILIEASKLYAPLAIVQTRAKSVSSFTEKIIRKNKYVNPLIEMTDLCGARIITHNEAQVNKICQFIKENFIIDEANSLDVSKRLNVSEFGYRSVHYIVTPAVEQILGIPIPVELRDKKAEIQVRTLLQHVWADILHDRLYKTAIKIPKEWQRESARLAALLENADENVSRLTALTDSYTANLGTVMTKEMIETEINTLQSILKYESNNKTKAGLALRIARLAKVLGNGDLSIKTLEPYFNFDSDSKLEISAEYGFALCSKYYLSKNDLNYKKGIEILGNLVENIITPEGKIENNDYIENGKATSLLLQYYAKIIDGVKDSEFISNIYNSAFQLDSQNPYLFAKIFEYNRQFPNQILFLRKNIVDSINICKEHIRLGIESINAYFTIGRFLLLLNENDEALNNYLNALNLCISNKVCLTVGVLKDEIESVVRLAKNHSLNEKTLIIERLLDLVCVCNFSDSDSLNNLKQSKMFNYNAADSILIIAGGTKSLDRNIEVIYENYLSESLKHFKGVILSGGTAIGVPGIVGSAVNKVRSFGNKDLNLVGYLPKTLPEGAKINEAYSIVKTEGKIFSQLEPIQMWIDIINSGINPNNVSLLGIGGGVISSFEYKLALVLGGSIALIKSNSSAASEILADSNWNKHPGLINLPDERETIWAFINKNTKSILEDTHIEVMAKYIHERYLEKQKAPDATQPNLKPWEELNGDLKKSNISQAIWIVEVLTKAGFEVKSKSGEIQLINFSKEEILTLAKLEHGRWNTERLLNGWKYGAKKDINKKITPYLVKWEELTEEIQQYDINAILEFPKLLKSAGCEIFRK